MKTFTIGFTQKTAQHFFSLIKKNNINRIIDVRLNITSQLSGFAKKEDLKYFLTEICQTDYIHIPDLTPTKQILDSYKNKAMTWNSYADKFTDLMIQRHIERNIDKNIFDNGCLLCSEHEPHQCHRRLVIEYLNTQWNEEIKVTHLK
jgi:uncharacterized protein (DUF488 family)